MKIAEVVISGSNREFDKKFSYSVPEGMKVKPGARVVVPFGKGNKKVSGIVTGFTDNSDSFKLKEISELIDSEPLCTPKLLDLAEYMRKICVCTYYQALRPLVASGATVKSVRWITLLDKSADIAKLSGRSKAKRKLLEILHEYGGTVDYATVAHISNVSAAVKSLEENGTVSLDDKLAYSVVTRTVRMVKLTSQAFERTDFSELAKKAPRQFKAVEILRQTMDISAADLAAFSGASYGTLASMEKKGIVEFYNKTVFRTAVDAGKYRRTEKLPLTAEQQNVFDGIIKNHLTENTKPNLIRGVTGSGKTEVFLQLIEYFLNKGKQAIFLVPEISLTPQTVDRFVGRFGDRVSVLHSGLSSGERFDEWKKIINGNVDVVVGARSAVFAPFNNLGIIIVDEEHEASYKAENAPAYDARQLARFRCDNENAMLVLASATPSVESYHKAKCGEYNLFEMKNRHNFNAMPKIDIVDMRDELKAGNHGVFSRRLAGEIDLNIKNGRQTILFLNRRGFNSFVMCRTCGEAIICKNCSVSMTYHKNSNLLKCHCCGFSMPVPNVCPECGSVHIRYMGTGTEKIEEELSKKYGKESFVRMDADTTSGKNSHEAILKSFERENIPILLGTQMVTKGLDFPNVTLVGVLAADMSLNADDYRAAERTFAQITQVCGRAGRGSLSGRAVVQTYQPEHYAVALASSHDYELFYKNEIEIRRRLSNPPFCDIVLIMMQGEDERSIVYELGRIAARLRKRGLNVLGPVPAPYTRINNMYRWRIIIKHKDAFLLLDLLRTISDFYAGNKNRLSIDINPNSMN